MAYERPKTVCDSWGGPEREIDEDIYSSERSECDRPRDDVERWLGPIRRALFELANRQQFTIDAVAALSRESDAVTRERIEWLIKFGVVERVSPIHVKLTSDGRRFLRMDQFGV